VAGLASAATAMTASAGFGCHDSTASWISVESMALARPPSRDDPEQAGPLRCSRIRGRFIALQADRAFISFQMRTPDSAPLQLVDKINRMSPPQSE
jgi:hypothetical protein